MQLSLVDDLGVEKRYFIDIFAETYFDLSKKKVRLKTIDGQPVPAELKVSCPHKFLEQFPEGTIYKLDVRLIRKDGFNPYFVAVNRRNIQRALEFFDYNLKVQNGFDYQIKPKKVIFLKDKKEPKPKKLDVFETF